ncbi:alpha/beta hydrolase [Viridibacterium curvum]|uniref:Alpha/beta hydrolase n=1 Tax=Viridibacterium curvum TaxID=1101404 RepID=A0ABP9QNS2_9RHOO
MNAKVIVRALLLAILISITAGCAFRGETPIATLRYENPSKPASEGKKLLIFLRGLGGGHEIFQNNGLVDQVIIRGLPFDMVAPDAHFGYYRDETLGRRLYEDIIVPARQQGYTEIWVAGTSLGGLGALFLQIEHPGEVDGIILLSPFLGWNGIVEEIQSAGGLARWEPGPHTVEDWQRYLWAWIKQYQARPERVPPIHLGYGASDLFVSAQDLLATALPEGRTTVVKGGHTYGTLRALWTTYLDRYGPALRRPHKEPLTAPPR